MWINTLLALLMFSSCGSHVVIDARGLRHSVDFSPLKKRAQHTLANRGKSGIHPTFIVEHSHANAFGPIGMAYYTVTTDVIAKNPKKSEIQSFAITTSYQVKDVFLSLIPFVSSRSVKIEGIQLRENKPKVKEDL